MSHPDPPPRGSLPAIGPLQEGSRTGRADAPWLWPQGYGHSHGHLGIARRCEPTQRKSGQRSKGDALQVSSAQCDPPCPHGRKVRSVPSGHSAQG